MAFLWATKRANCESSDHKHFIQLSRSFLFTSLWFYLVGGVAVKEEDNPAQSDHLTESFIQYSWLFTGYVHSSSAGWRSVKKANRTGWEWCIKYWEQKKRIPCPLNIHSRIFRFRSERELARLPPSVSPFVWLTVQPNKASSLFHQGSERASFVPIY